ncbi:MAG: hypothetical protein GX154_03695 [Clostridiales bacterium]|nr:hypothetical protein [Clostridiales bacterium]
MKRAQRSDVFRFLLIVLIIVHFVEFSIYSSIVTYQLKFLIPLIMVIEWLVRIRFKVKFRINSAPLFFMVYILFVVLVLSLLNTENESEAIIQGLSYVILLIVSFLVVPNYIETKEDYVKFLKLFFIMFFMLLLANVILGRLMPGVAFTNFNNRLRYRGVFGNPNSLGFFSMMGLIVSISLTVLTSKKHYLYSGILFLSLIYYSDSNTSLIASMLFIVSMVLIWGLFKGNSLARVLSILSTTLLLTSIILGVIWISFNSNVYSLERVDEIFHSRVSRSLISISDYDFLDFLIGKGIASRVTNPHNAVINTLVELGLLGLTMIYGIKLYIAGYALIVIKNSANIFCQKMMMISVSMLLTFFVFGIAESVSISLGNIVSVFMWASFGAQMGLAQKGRYQRKGCHNEKRYVVR